jgi:hypothetical protein
MWNWSGIPPHPLMEDYAIYRPSDVSGPPVNRVKMKIFGCIEAKFYTAGRSPIAKADFSAIITRVEINVRKHPSRITTGYLDINLLSGRASMEEKTCN